MYLLHVPLITLNEIQRIKLWQVAHRREQPMEYRLWEAVLTIWVMGCVGWLPLLIVQAWWLVPLLALATFAPQIYVSWRTQACRAQRLRCDWLTPLP